HQKMQYLTTIIASQQIFGLNFFVALLFLISSEYHTIIRLENVMPITLILIVIGLLVFVLKSMRYYWLLKQGAYRSESDRDMFRKTLEKTKSFMPVVIGATALYMIISNTGYSIYLINPERLVLYLSSILVYCAMMFV